MPQKPSRPPRSAAVRENEASVGERCQRQLGAAGWLQRQTQRLENQEILQKQKEVAVQTDKGGKIILSL